MNVRKGESGETVKAGETVKSGEAEKSGETGEARRHEGAKARKDNEVNNSPFLAFVLSRFFGFHGFPCFPAFSCFPFFCIGNIKRYNLRLLICQLYLKQKTDIYGKKR